MATHLECAIPRVSLLGGPIPDAGATVARYHHGFPVKSRKKFAPSIKIQHLHSWALFGGLGRKYLKKKCKIYCLNPFVTKGYILYPVTLAIFPGWSVLVKEYILVISLIYILWYSYIRGRMVKFIHFCHLRLHFRGPKTDVNYPVWSEKSYCH